MSAIEVAGAPDVPLGLVFAQPSEITHLNILLYSPPGQGKSTAACSAPPPVLAVNFNTASAFLFARSKFGDAAIHEVECYKRSRNARAELAQIEAHLRSEPPEQTVVLDSVGEVYEALLKELGGVSPKIQHHGQVQTIIKDFVGFLCRLDRHVVLICHEQINDNEEGGATRRPETGGQKLPEQVMKLMDVVAYCGIAPAQENEPERYVGQTVQARGRRAKTRFPVLAPSRELCLAEWVDVVHESLRPDVPWEPEAGS